MQKRGMCSRVRLVCGYIIAVLMWSGNLLTRRSLHFLWPSLTPYGEVSWGWGLELGLGRTEIWQPLRLSTNFQSSWPKREENFGKLTRSPNLTFWSEGRECRDKYLKKLTLLKSGRRTSFSANARKFRQVSCFAFYFPDTNHLPSQKRESFACFERKKEKFQMEKEIEVLAITWNSWNYLFVTNVRWTGQK